MKTVMEIFLFQLVMTHIAITVSFKNSLAIVLILHSDLNNSCEYKMIIVGSNHGHNSNYPVIHRQVEHNLWSDGG